MKSGNLNEKNDGRSETIDYLQPKDCLIPLNIRPTDLPIIETSRNDTALLTLAKAARKKGMLMSQNSRYKLKQYLLQATDKMAHYSKTRRKNKKKVSFMSKYNCSSISLKRESKEGYHVTLIVAHHLYKFLQKRVIIT